VVNGPRRLFADKKARFLVVGGINTVWGIAAYPILYLLLNPLGVHYLATLVLSYAVSIAFSFTTQKYVVFRTRGNIAKELSKFLGLQSVILALNLLALPLFVNATSGSPVAVQVVLSVFVAIVSYFFHNHVTFRSPSEAGRNPADGP